MPSFSSLSLAPPPAGFATQSAVLTVNAFDAQTAFDCVAELCDAMPARSVTFCNPRQASWGPERMSSFEARDDELNAQRHALPSELSHRGPGSYRVRVERSRRLGPLGPDGAAPAFSSLSVASVTPRDLTATPLFWATAHEPSLRLAIQALMERDALASSLSAPQATRRSDEPRPSSL